MSSVLVIEWSNIVGGGLQIRIPLFDTFKCAWHSLLWVISHGKSSRHKAINENIWVGYIARGSMAIRHR